MRGLTGCRQISLHTHHHQAHTYVHPRRPACAPAPASTTARRLVHFAWLQGGSSQVHWLGLSTVTENNAPAARDLLQTRPGYYPATGPISARPKSVILRAENPLPPNRPGRHVSMCHVPLQLFASFFAVPRALVGWLARWVGTVM